jgi:hypothetical protein
MVKPKANLFKIKELRLLNAGRKLYKTWKKINKYNLEPQAIKPPVFNRKNRYLEASLFVLPSYNRKF